MALFSFQSAHLSHGCYNCCFIFIVYLFWSDPRSFFSSVLARCYCVSIQHDVKLDVSHNAKLLFYVSFLFQDINWMLFERVEWQHLICYFPVEEISCSSSGGRRNNEAKSFSFRDANVGIVLARRFFDTSVNGEISFRIYQ